jgi:hypothetical protein
MQMDQHIPQIVEAHGLSARAVSYKYRYCPRCRRDWPADHTSCRECCHWLGEQPLERTEWQLYPTDGVPSEPRKYECIGASAVVLRLVCGYLSAEQLIQLVGPLAEIFPNEDDAATSGVAQHGWLVWTKEGLRAAFFDGSKIEQRLQRMLPRLEGIVPSMQRILGIIVQPGVTRCLGRTFSNKLGDDLLCTVEMVDQAILYIITQHPINLIEQGDQAVNCARPFRCPHGLEADFAGENNDLWIAVLYQVS